MDSQELCCLTIADAAQRLQAREISPVELTQAHLDRIQAVDGKLNAYITVTADRALEEASQAERAFASGQVASPLQGIPVATKDLMYTRGTLTSAGSKVLSDFVPDYDATVMERLHSAGAVLLGKLNLMEFAMGGSFHNVHYGDIHNPWDLDRFPGGSSSGSGAATAAGLCMGALGTDTGGSIRSPANNCGIVGLKPTYGLVSRHGVVPLSWSLDHVGPMTRTVEDCALLLQVVAGHDPKDPTSSRAPVPDYTAHLREGIRGLRIGILRPHFFQGLSEEVAQAVEQALTVFTELGATLKEVSLERATKARVVYDSIVYPEATAYHLPWMRTRIDDYGPNTRGRLEQGLALPATAYVQAQQERRLLVRDATSVLEQADLLLAPGAARTPPRLDEEGSAAPRGSTNVFNITGIPVLSVPCGFSNTNLPISFQLIGRPFDEVTVLRAAHAYEQVTPWHQRHPNL